MSETFINLIPFPQLSLLLSQLKHLHILLEDFDLTHHQQTKLQITEDSKGDITEQHRIYRNQMSQMQLVQAFC